MDGRMMLFEQLRALEMPFTSIVQVGANRGKEVAAYANYGLDWAVMVEPQEDAFDKLRKRVAGHPRFIAVQALCSEVDGEEYDFFIASNKGQSSSLLKPTRHRIKHPTVEFPTQIRLVSTTLDTLLDGVASEHPALALATFDTLLIDAQGAELKVLMGATRLLRQVNYVYSEISFDLYDGGATLDDLQGYLRGFGFHLHYLQLNRHGWGDGLFIKTGPAAAP